MPSILPSRMTQSHNAPTQGDFEILSLLTSDSSSLGPLSPHHESPTNKKKALPRRDQPLDALLISAVLAGSGPVTRHHFPHGGGE